MSSNKKKAAPEQPQATTVQAPAQTVEQKLDMIQATLEKLMKKISGGY